MVFDTSEKYRKLIDNLEKALIQDATVTDENAAWELLLNGALDSANIPGALSICEQWTGLRPLEPAAWMNFETVFSHDGKFVEAAQCVDLHARLTQICILAWTTWSHAFLQSFR